MKKILISLMLILSLNMQPVYAKNYEMDAQTEQVKLLAQFAKQVGLTALYVSTIGYAVLYVASVGALDSNAAMDALSTVAPNLSEFQDKLNFSDASSFASLLGKKVGDFAQDNGMEDWKNGVESSLGQLKNEAGDAIQGAKDKVDGAIQGAKSKVDEVTQDIKDAANKAKETVADTAGKVKDGVSETVFGNTSSKNSDSAAQKVIVVKSNFGEPQPNRQAAINFIRSRYYYSTKEGDTYDGKELMATSEARSRVGKNRIGYYQEVIAMALSTGYEGSTTVNEDSIERLKSLQNKMNQAKTVDEKKAVEALIVQEETRQRLIKLNYEIAELEADLVEEIQTVEPEYIIARTPEQVIADTKSVVGAEK